MVDVAVIVLSAAVFIAVILGVAVNQDNREKWVGVTFLAAAIGGICLYGAAYSEDTSFAVAILKTVIDVGKMFGGANNAAVFQKIVGENSPWMTAFWIIHFLAYYSMASAIIMAVAKTTLKKIRGWFLRINDIDLVFGINDNSIAYGRNLSGKKKTSIVYVGKEASSHEAEIRQMGGLLYTDSDAVHPSGKFLKRLSIKRGKGKFRVSALSKNIDANIEYAMNMLGTLEKAKIKPSQTELILLGKEEQNGSKLQALGDYYGYGSVRVFDKPELIARLLMQEYPICDAISFDDNARALEDTDILLVGFGRKGQEVLKKLVANGQFEGSSFKVTIFDANCKNTDGFFAAKYETLLENYNIDFQAYDGRSRAFTQFLTENISKLKYIVIAVGDEKVGREIALGIIDYMVECDIHLPVYQCCTDSVVKYSGDNIPEKHDIYETDILYDGKMDDLAKKLNHYYCRSDETQEESWAQCNYFNRMSSRASADFLSSYLRRVGLSGKSEISDAMMENLAKTEHLRWCAFHYSFGYRCMEKKIIDERAEMYKKDPSVRITKDTRNRLHACLIPWDDLDWLSEFESGIRGKDIDYKQMDRDNVNVIFNLMKKG
ncbi:hypothetical protein [Butyrivibrio sp. YAB3001]|uniref:hypothetical protein n=1 Tax=Butyrivibrio sp. YAB3001 TaxID=1520812 RepID=UPI0008F62D9C|nr:hypothetical protein [Butyrivibrio sp. YAB3001]SFC59839.1 hypothetical protein SAMN02910398_02639 [Butyrivibrio sp. YAB3001]